MREFLLRRRLILELQEHLRDRIREPRGEFVDVDTERAGELPVVNLTRTEPPAFLRGDEHPRSDQRPLRRRRVRDRHLVVLQRHPPAIHQHRAPVPDEHRRHDMVAADPVERA